MFQTLKQFRPDHWAWIHAKAVFITWATLVLIFTPARVQDVLDRALVIAVCSVIIIGMLTSVVGLYKSMDLVKKKAALGVKIELAGLWLAMSGPASYLVTQIYILTQPNPGDRISQVALIYLIMAFVYVRIVIIYTHRKKVES